MRLYTQFVGTILIVLGLLPAVAKAADVEAMLGERAIGAADAPVTMVELSSLTCPHCADFHRETLPLIKATYIDTGKVRLVYRDFPLDALALGAAMLTRCVPADQFFPFLDTLFHEQLTWARSDSPVKALQALAADAGLAEADFRACLGNGRLMAGIRETANSAGQANGITSTPSFLINGEKIVGAAPFVTFQTAIEAALANAATAGTAPATPAARP